MLVFACLLFLFGLVVYQTEERAGMLLYSGLVVGVVLVGAAGAWSWRRQWLLVPGGLVIRKARWTGGAWRIHLYRRRSSVLLLYQQIHRGNWMLCVADAEASDATRLTKTEAYVALSSWLSPLPPPPAERLRDLR